MKREVVYIICILLSMTVHAQENLVPNGGFENLTTCPHLGPNGGEIWLAEPWDNIVDIGGGADIFNLCAQLQIITTDTFHIYNVPENHRGHQPARSGEGYAGFYAVSDPETYPNGREFIQTPLTESLHAGVRYEVTFYVSLAERYQYAISSFGAFFSVERLSASGYYLQDLPAGVEPQIQTDSEVIYDDKENWMEIRDTFAIRSGEDGQQWMTIGNFLPDSLSNITFVDSGFAANYDRAYYYIDDVSVVALDSVPSGVGIEEVERERAFKVYPNPNNGHFTLAYNLTYLEDGEVRVFDMVGKQVFTQTLSSEANTLDMNLSEVNAGVYLVSLEVNGESRFTERLSILK